MLEALFISNDFNGHNLLQLVIVALQSLPEAARAKLIHNFEAICQMVLHDHLVISSFVIKPKVVAKKRSCLDLFRFEAEEVNFLIILNFYLFIIGHTLILEELQGLTTRHWEGHFIDTNCRGGLLRI